MLKNKKNRYIKTHNLFLSCTILCTSNTISTKFGPGRLLVMTKMDEWWGLEQPPEKFHHASYIPFFVEKCTYFGGNSGVSELAGMQMQQ